MRVFLMLRGIAGCGKSTWVKENCLEHFTVESDAVRRLYNGIGINDYGMEYIPQVHNDKVWTTIKEILQYRMRKEELVVLDATNVDQQSYRDYKKLCKKNNYRFFIVDFTPNFTNAQEKQDYLSMIISRNMQRLEYDRVPEEFVRRQFNKAIKKDYIPEKYIITPDQLEEKVYYRKYDLNKYNKVRIFSDIHGNYTIFKEALGEMKDDEFYIFLGDYVDRGLENDKVIEWLYQAIEKPNIILLQGNHERWLRLHADDKVDEIKSREYVNNTLRQIEIVDNWREKLNSICKKLSQVYYFTYKGNDYLCTHGGVSYFDERIVTYSAEEVVYSRGDQDIMAETFTKNINRSNIFNVHGHISFEDSSKTKIGNVININSRVEFGESLVTLTLDESGQSVYRYEVDESKLSNKDLEKKKIVELTRSPNLIVTQVSSDITSITFAKEAFHKKLWDEYTIQARGLFYNNRAERVQARGYKKFFNYGEFYDYDDNDQELNAEEALKRWEEHWKEKLAYPINVYKKENGFLGMITLDEDNNLVVATKTKMVLEKDFDTLLYSGDEFPLKWFLQLIFNKIFSNIFMDDFKGILKDLVPNKTLIFEVMDIDNDKHIIGYRNSTMVLLDAVTNTILKEEYLPFEELVKLADRIGVPHKQLKTKLYSWKELQEFIPKARKELGIEGYVLVDSEHNMFKLKTEYYLKWKRYREVLVGVQKGIKPNIKMNDLDKKLYKFLLDNNLKELDLWQLQKIYDENMFFGDLEGINNESGSTISNEEGTRENSNNWIDSNKSSKNSDLFTWDE